MITDWEDDWRGEKELLIGFTRIESSGVVLCNICGYYTLVGLWVGDHTKQVMCKNCVMYGGPDFLPSDQEVFAEHDIDSYIERTD